MKTRLFAFFFIIAVQLVHADSERTIDILSVRHSNRTLVVQVFLLNYTHQDSLIRWLTPDFCPETNPSLFNAATHEFVPLKRERKSNQRPQFMTPFPQQTERIITLRAELPEGGLPPGDYVLNLTHPLDPERTDSHAFSVAEPSEPQPYAGFVKTASLPVPGAEPPQSNAALSDDYLDLFDLEFEHSTDSIQDACLSAIFALDTFFNNDALREKLFSLYESLFRVIYPTARVNTGKGLITVSARKRARRLAAIRREIPLEVHAINWEEALSLDLHLFNHTGHDGVLRWHPLYCEGINPVLFCTTRNEFIVPRISDAETPTDARIEPFPKKTEQNITVRMELPEGGLTPGDYILTLTHPLDSEMTLSYPFTVVTDGPRQPPAAKGNRPK